MPDRGKRGFNWVAGADALPMLGGEVEECHELFAIFLQAPRCLGILWLIGFDEQIECLVRIVFGLSLPDIVDRGLGLRLRQLDTRINPLF